MHFNLTKPCKHCPFRNDIRPFLSTRRVREIIASLIGRQESFPCHKTVDYSHDDDGRVTSKSEHCAGAMILLEKLGKPNQMMRICERLGLYDRRKLDMNAPVYRDPRQMIAMHDKQQRIEHTKCRKEAHHG